MICLIFSALSLCIAINCEDTLGQSINYAASLLNFGIFLICIRYDNDKSP